jgi:hypothetical protein
MCAHASAIAQPAPAPSGPGDEGPGPEEALTQRIAVWRIDALGMPPELVARLETLFRMELDRLATRPLPTRMQIDKAVGGALANCSGDDRCIADIGKRVGVDVMVAGSVAALGDSYILNIKAVDVQSAKQIRRIATDPLRGSPDELIEAIRVAKSGGATEEQLKPALDLQRKAQWRLDFVSSENSMGFHAAQETVRILAEAIDYSRQAQIAANSLRLAAVQNPKEVPVTPVQGVTPANQSPAAPDTHNESPSPPERR